MSTPKPVADPGEEPPIERGTSGPEEPNRDTTGDPVSFAREIALRQLTVRARSRGELSKALAKRKVPDEIAEQVLDRLEEVGLVDDAVFARDWLAAGSRRQKSRRALVAELAEKGVDRDIVQAAADELDADRDLEVARAFAARKARGLVGLGRDVAYRRLAGSLARRGFSAGVVAQVTRETLAALPDLLADWPEES